MKTTPSLGAAAADLSPPIIRLQMECILASDLFANTESLRNVLRYCIERTLAGETEKLKEYSIGVEVFGRGAEFDPRIDPIVRVQARRLRSRLQQYYRAEARAGETVIELPKGSYVRCSDAANATLNR